MSNRKTKKSVRKIDRQERLREALAKAPKNELVDVLTELSERDCRLFRELGVRFKLETPEGELASATRLAIADATDFDERDINRNFDYDYAAYEEVKCNLVRLVELKQLPLAMELALELMRQGSSQVEMSDEGLMASDIEDCLAVVVKALYKSDLPSADVIAWCNEMYRRDRIRAIYHKELDALRSHIKKLQRTG